MSNSTKLKAKTTKNTAELEVLYFEEALKNYDEKNYKLCIIYLNKVKLDTSEKVRLFVDVTYDVWQDHAYNERHVYIKYIESAYTTLFDEEGAGVPNPYDFVRLSFVYITQNSMAMAYKIMELAAIRGFQTNVLIALQTWSIVERLQIKKRLECL